MIVLEQGSLADNSIDKLEVTVHHVPQNPYNIYTIIGQLHWVHTAYQRAGLIYLSEGLVNDAKEWIMKGNLDPRLLGFLLSELRDCLSLTETEKEFLVEHLGTSSNVFEIKINSLYDMTIILQSKNLLTIWVISLKIKDKRSI
jgi:hypothetical protein